MWRSTPEARGPRPRCASPAAAREFRSEVRMPFLPSAPDTVWKRVRTPRGSAHFTPGMVRRRSTTNRAGGGNRPASRPRILRTAQSFHRAFCEMEQGFDVEWLCSLVMAVTMGAGTRP